MARVKRGMNIKAKHKKVLALAKGFRGRAKNCFKIASLKVAKALAYSTRDRKVRKRDFRALWIVRINAACRMNGIKYSELIYGLKEANINLNRKVIAEMAIHNMEAFNQLCKEVMPHITKLSGYKEPEVIGMPIAA